MGSAHAEPRFVSGCATAEGTARYRDRFRARLPGHFRQAAGVWLSSIGLGTYLGEPNERYDQLYDEAASLALGSGINVIDTAVNYRHQRSEQSIGRALRGLIQQGTLERDQVFLATKGGFLSFEGNAPRDPASYLYERVIRSGLAKPEDVAADCHVITPAYLKDQIEVSRKNLGVETIDLYYVHNPETQLTRRSREEFYARLRDAFAALEAAVAEGKIRSYGVATWNAFRVAGEEFIALPDVIRAAREAGGAGHHFRAVQLPFNLAMPEALVKPTQPAAGGAAPLLRAASELGLMVFASATLLQGQLSSDLPAEITRHFHGLSTDAERAIQFVRSTPGITCALVGMSSAAHVRTNLGAAAVPPLSIEEYQAVFSG